MTYGGMLDNFIAKSATAHKVNSYYTLATFYCTFCVGNHTILGPATYSLYAPLRNAPLGNIAVTVYNVHCLNHRLTFAECFATIQP